jgi:hypothetical protein
MQSLPPLFPPLAGLCVLAIFLVSACIREAHLIYNYLDQFSVFSRYLPRPSRLKALGMAIPIVLFGGLIPALVSLFINRKNVPPLVASQVLTCALLQFPFTFVLIVFLFHRMLPASPKRSMKVAGCLIGLLIPVFGAEWLIIKLASRLLVLYAARQ